MGQLKASGYKNMWFNWIHHNLSSNDDRERLQFVKLELKLTNRSGFYATSTGKKRASLKLHDSAPGPGVRRYCPEPFLCILYN